MEQRRFIEGDFVTFVAKKTQYCSYGGVYANLIDERRFDYYVQPLRYNLGPPNLCLVHHIIFDIRKDEIETPIMTVIDFNSVIMISNFPTQLDIEYLCQEERLYAFLRGSKLYKHYRGATIIDDSTIYWNRLLENIIIQKMLPFLELYKFPSRLFHEVFSCLIEKVPHDNNTISEHTVIPIMLALKLIEYGLEFRETDFDRENMILSSSEKIKGCKNLQIGLKMREERIFNMINPLNNFPPFISRIISGFV